MILEAFWGSLGLLVEALGGSLGPLDRPKGASRFVLELSWAWFARFLLPKMAFGGFWGRLWLVLGAPEGLLRVVLASVKPISTIKTALPSFDTLFSLVVVEYIIILIIIIVVVIDSAQLQFCQTVHLESSFFFKPLIFPRKVMARQIDPLCASHLFLWPAG